MHKINSCNDEYDHKYNGKLGDHGRSLIADDLPFLFSPFHEYRRVGFCGWLDKYRQYRRRYPTHHLPASTSSILPRACERSREYGRSVSLRVRVCTCAHEKSINRPARMTLMATLFGDHDIELELTLTKIRLGRIGVIQNF